MPQFTYTVRQQDGTASSGVLEAPDRNSAMRALVDKDLVVTRLSLVKPASGRFGGSSGLSNEQLLSFTQSLAAMLDAGMTLTQALSILALDAESPILREILVRVEAQIGEGRSFSSGLKEFPKVFSRLYVSMIEAGESSGKLPEIMARLARYIEESSELQGKVQGALLYPVIVMSCALALLVGLFIFAVPRLSEVYQGLGVALPAATVLFIKAGHLLGATWFIWLPALILGGLALKHWTDRPQGRLALDRLKLKVPLLGPLFRKVAVARFARTLGSLYVSGIPLHVALELVSRSLDNAVLEQAVNDVSNNLLKGESLASQMREQQVFTQIAVSMVAAGEESGSLDRMLDKLASFYETQVAIALKSLVSLIEPMLMVGIGVVVGGAILVISLPFLQLAKVLQ